MRAEHKKLLNVEQKIEEIYLLYRGSLPDVYRWENEKERFLELYFSILTRAIDINRLGLHELLAGILELNLLDISELAEASLTGGKSKRGDVLAATIEILLKENYLSADEAHTAVTILCKLCNALSLNFEGKVQKLIRKYGKMMLADLKKALTHSGLADADLEYALIFWLQTTMEMPILLGDKSMLKFCKTNGISIDELEKYIDKLDINAAVADDLIQIYQNRNVKAKR